MKICPGCQRRYDDAAKFCPHDGTVLPEASDAYVGLRLMGQFDILERCGEGAMGTVYRARQAPMERDVAVKILRRDLVRDPVVVKRFYREARAAARLSHPNIVTVHLVAETEDGVPYIVMELLEGKDLDTLCRAEAPMPVPRALNLAQQIAAALEEAHLHDVIHRDLKPANIIVSDRQRAPDLLKVLDFGIAKILEGGASDESRITKSGAIFGTPFYLSPEQATGGELDARADLYSLGVILYRMVTGHLPFEGGSGLDVLVRQVKAPPPPPRQFVPDLPAALEQIILRTLEKDREARHASAGELRAQLLALLSQFDPAGAVAVSKHGSPWSVPVGTAAGEIDPTRLAGPAGVAADAGKKTVTGFSNPEEKAAPYTPGDPEADPLVQAASRILVSDRPSGQVRARATEGPRGTVFGTPVGAGGDPAETGGAPSLAEGIGAATDEPATDSVRERLTVPAALAPAPVPPAVLPAVSPEPSRRQESGARRPAPDPLPAVRSAPLDKASEAVPHTVPATGSPAGAGAPAPAASSPSMVSGQYVTADSDGRSTWSPRDDQGRWILAVAVGLALVALGAGGYFLFRDRQDRRQRQRSAANRVSSQAGADGGGLEADAALASARRSGPSFSAGRELLRAVVRGVGVRVSSEDEWRAGGVVRVLVDLWRDDTGTGLAGAEVALAVRTVRRAPARWFPARSALVAGRYGVRLPLPRARRPWTLQVRVHVPGEAVRIVEETLRAERSAARPALGRPGVRRGPSARWARRTRPRGRLHQRPLAAQPARPRERPQGLPRPPPDEGTMGTGGSGESDLPQAPPAPPPDPD